MKKSKLVATITFIAILLLNLSTARAESSDIAYSYPVFEKKMTAPGVQAVKNFEQSFTNISGEKWNKNNDGYRVRFTENGARFMVDYDNKGRWVSTIKTYGEDLLSEEVANSILASFLGYNIVHVSEIQMQKGTVYLVKIENKDQLKTIRFRNGELDVFEEYRKK